MVQTLAQIQQNCIIFSCFALFFIVIFYSIVGTAKKCSDSIDYKFSSMIDAEKLYVQIHSLRLEIEDVTSKVKVIKNNSNLDSKTLNNILLAFSELDLATKDVSLAFKSLDFNKYDSIAKIKDAQIHLANARQAVGL